MNANEPILDLLAAHPIIAAVRDETDLQAALDSSAQIIFILNATLSNLKNRVDRVKIHDKLSFVHLEMIAGLSKDPAALEFIKTGVTPSGIITTKPNLVQPAKALGLYTVQRLFLLDSLSIQTGLKMMQSNQTDFIEIMPGIIPKVIPEIRKHSRIPLIAGGMIDVKEEIIELLKAGAVAVSTSRKELWEL